VTDERLRDEKIRSVNRQDVSLEYVDPGEERGLLEQAWAGGVVLDYVPVTSKEDLGESEVLRRVVLFTARGLCVARGLDPVRRSIPRPFRDIASSWTSSTVGESTETGAAC
jgi:hypothetical protein